MVEEIGLVSEINLLKTIKGLKWVGQCESCDRYKKSNPLSRLSLAIVESLKATAGWLSKFYLTKICFR